MDKYFYQYLYSKGSVLDMLEAYCDPMLKSENPLVRMKGECGLRYWNIRQDTVFKSRLMKKFASLYEDIKRNNPAINIQKPCYRYKTLISALNKLDMTEELAEEKIKEEFIKQYSETMGVKTEKEFAEAKRTILKSISSKESNAYKEEYKKFVNNYIFNKNPFDRIMDFLAFRIILVDDGTPKYVDLLYDIANHIIDFFCKDGYKPIEAFPTIQTGELAVTSSLIIIPKESGIKAEYKNFAKDYVIGPKKNGLQTITIIFYDPYTQKMFEVQLQTASMFIVSQTLADHKNYKIQRYGKHLTKVSEKINYSKIHLDDSSFRYYKYTDPVTGEEKEYIYDKAGIIEPISGIVERI